MSKKKSASVLLTLTLLRMESATKTPADHFSLKNNAGNYLLSHRVAPKVPSALEGLTTVFGMGTGVTLPVSSPTKFVSTQFTTALAGVKLPVRANPEERQPRRDEGSHHGIAQFFKRTN